MNERIKLLAKQAGSTHKQNLGVYQFYTDELEKFAELIVGECCQKLEDDGMVEIAIEMKQHFGVGMSTADKKTLVKELLGVNRD